jgi:para-nitrobenzyl esterase
MSVAAQAPTVRTEPGSLEGRWLDDVAAFLGIPYAEPLVGPRRWAPPVPAGPWDGTRSAHQPGPVPPQHAARLEAAMGPMRAPASGEDCLTLNVWTPAPASSERLPVMVFIHGGGYLTGAGSAAWYDGRVMARRGPAVVVTFNYRLGALGYLYLSPELTGGGPVANLGLQDQRLALEWVAANAAAFGGDPDSITVFGQSGGGHSIVALSGMAAGRPPFSRAILQSPPLGMPAAQPPDAERSTRLFLEAAGMPDATLDDLRALPVETIIAAQRQTLARTAVPGRLDPPFQLVVDGEVLVEEPTARACALLDDVDLMVGFTSDEGRAFLAFDEPLWNLPPAAVVGNVRERGGERPADRLQAYVDHRPDRPAAAALSDMVSDAYLVAPTVRLAEERARQGRPVYLFRVSWASDALDGRVGACHTIELPLVFANLDAWCDAPMLGAALGEAAEVAPGVQDAWTSFAATGRPQSAALGEWPTCTAERTPTMDIDRVSRIADDPSDGRRYLW